MAYVTIPGLLPRGLPVYTTGPLIGHVVSDTTKYDPWVVVGTTTLDGTIMQVATMLDASGWGPPLTESEAESAIDLFMKQDERHHEPWLVGGRCLRARGCHINGGRGTALIRCDIVRRQSEIDAEQCAELAAMARKIDEEELADYLSRPPCSECGPHGNAGEVLLASTWVRCTLCGGGKSGDAFGAVEEEQAPTERRNRIDSLNPQAKWTKIYFDSGRVETYDVPAGATAVEVDEAREAVVFHLSKSGICGDMMHIERGPRS